MRVKRLQSAGLMELFRDLVLRSRDESWRPPAASLFERLIGPAETAGWLSDADHLMLVPHGVLHELPFAALLREEQGVGKKQSGGEPLVARYRLTYLPSATALTVARIADSVEGTVLALAPDSTTLPFTRQETTRVAAHFDQPKVIVGHVATAQSLKQLAPGFRVLHLATHGYFNPRSPLLSGLELEPGGGEDGRLETHEILGLGLAADLVTLSACSSALGGGLVDDVPVGGEWVGLSRAFLTAGSKAILATLGRVEDRSTMEFMEGFYARRNERSGEGEAMALAAVQRRMSRLNGEAAHPYFWAPFVLMRGESPARDRKTGSVVRAGE